MVILRFLEIFHFPITMVPWELEISKMLKFLEIIFLKENISCKGKYWMFQYILFVEMKIS